MNPQEQGFAVTPARLGFAISILALLTIGWQTVDYVKAQEFVVESHSVYIAESKIFNKEMLAELKILNEKVSRLVFLSESGSSAPFTAPRAK